MSKTILVTGAAGFIGSRFVESCITRGWSVISVDKRAYFSSRPEHQSLNFGTVVDRKDLFDWVQKENPSIGAIVHLGACTDTMEFNEEYLTEINREYSKKIWELTTERKIPLVYASSAATYGDGSSGYNDDESKIPTLKPLNPYGQSKQDVDLWVLEEEKRQAPPSWSAFKFFNVYGFGERHKTRMSSVVLKAYDQIRTQGKVRLFKSHKEGIADGHQKRDFIYIDDVISVLWFALEKPIKRGIFNLGTGKAETFLSLVRPIFKALDKPEKIIYIDTPEDIQDKYQYFTEANMNKLKKAGYAKPFTSVEQGVTQYVKQLIERW